MRKVIGIGETVLDIIFKDGQPIGAVPGGSVFNGIISLGRAGIPAMFISETGNDRVGKHIIDFARNNGVNADSINVFPDSKSPVSLAFLDDNNDAEYLFYKDHPHDRLDFVYPDIQPDDIVMFGSFYAVNPVIRPQVAGFLEYARQRGAILYYDVNFRAYGKDDPLRVYNAEISFYCKRFICTRGAQPVSLIAGGIRKEYPIVDTQTVSTIGAGDNFNAGLVYGMMHHGILRSHIEQGLSEEQWDSIILWAQLFSANCCQSIHNSISVDFGQSLQQERNGFNEKK